MQNLPGWTRKATQTQDNRTTWSASEPRQPPVRATGLFEGSRADVRDNQTVALFSYLQEGNLALDMRVRSKYSNECVEEEVIRAASSLSWSDNVGCVSRRLACRKPSRAATEPYLHRVTDRNSADGRTTALRLWRQRGKSEVVFRRRKTTRDD